MRRPFNFVCVVLTGVGVDLLAKWFVFHSLHQFEAMEVIPGVLRIVRSENRGVAFSIMSGHTHIIVVISVAAIIIMSSIYAKFHLSMHRVNLAALALLLVGAIGNLVDRLAFDYVRDFIDFTPRLPLIGHWAVFNVADICITCGAILYAIHEIFLRKEKTPSK